MKVLIILVLVCAVLFIERFSLQKPEENLQVKAKFDERLTEPGQGFNLLITAENHGWMPMFYLQLTFSIPKGLTPSDEKWAETHCRETIGTRTVVETIYLLPHQRITIKVPLKAEKRGWYVLGNIFATGGDFFGLKTVITSHSQHAEIVVMPEKMDLKEKPEAIGGFFGDVSTRRWMFEDPVLTAGYSDYTGREPMKNIAWGQSARLNRLTVRQFDHTAENTVAVLLNMDDTDEESAERCFSCARAVVELLEERRMTWSFISNGYLRSPNGISAERSGGQGKVHMNTILEMLGRATYGVTIPFSDVVNRIAHGISSSNGYIIIVPNDAMKNSDDIRRMKNLSGGMVYTISAGGETA